LQYAQPRGDQPHKEEHDFEQREFLGKGKQYPLGQLWIEGGDRLAGMAIKKHPAVEHQWSGTNPVVVVDGFLTADALERLRRFCWNSTIWREVYAGGYLGAFPEHGLACPLLAQIAEELKANYPTIFRDHPLMQIWAFKYGHKLQGIPLHADFAAVNVNFWITPDEANTDASSGGLIIWDKPAPPAWDFAKYNADPTSAKEFLEKNGAKSTTIPYRSNRGVIFDSDLFHETDSIAFAPGYCNRRINITLLYGRRRPA